MFKLELPMIVTAALLMAVLAWDGQLSQVDGCIMLLAGMTYTAALIWMIRRTSPAAVQEFHEECGPQSIPFTRLRWRVRVGYAAMLGAGIALTVIGAELLVRGAVSIAQWMGVSPAIIGLTMVAFGTSSPELVTTMLTGAFWARLSRADPGVEHHAVM